MPIQHEGSDYYSKAEIEEIVRDRVSRVGAQLTEARGAAEQLEQRLAAAEGRAATADTLTAQIGELQARLEGVQGEHARFRTATSLLGVTDPDTIATLEFHHQRAGAAAGSFEDWLAQGRTDPAVLPELLRPLFSGAAAGAQGAQGAAAGAQGAQGRAWRSSQGGLRRVAPGSRGDFTARVAAASTIDELVALSADRRR